MSDNFFQNYLTATTAPFPDYVKAVTIFGEL